MDVKKKLIYVAGYGRSGSTLLERILASHDQVRGLGEACVFYSLNDVHALECAFTICLMVRSGEANSNPHILQTVSVITVSRLNSPIII